MDLLQEIKKEMEKIDYSTGQMYNVVKGLGAQMYFYNVINHDIVVKFCANMIKMYMVLKTKDKE